MVFDSLLSSGCQSYQLLSTTIFVGWLLLNLLNDVLLARKNILTMPTRHYIHIHIVHIYTYTHTHTHAHTHTYTHIRAHPHTHNILYTHIYIHIYKTYIYIYIYTYTHHIYRIYKIDRIYKIYKIYIHTSIHLYTYTPWLLQVQAMSSSSSGASANEMGATYVATRWCPSSWTLSW